MGADRQFKPAVPQSYGAEKQAHNKIIGGHDRQPVSRDLWVEKMRRGEQQATQYHECRGIAQQAAQSLQHITAEHQLLGRALQRRQQQRGQCKR